MRVQEGQDVRLAPPALPQEDQRPPGAALGDRPQRVLDVCGRVGDAEEVSRVLRRTEEARIYHWHKATGKFPPRRGRPDG